jgi:hypothetical protein
MAAINFPYGGVSKTKKGATGEMLNERWDLHERWLELKRWRLHHSQVRFVEKIGGAEFLGVESC